MTIDGAQIIHIQSQGFTNSLNPNMLKGIAKKAKVTPTTKNKNVNVLKNSSLFNFIIKPLLMPL
ncbi:hypothetical protein AMD27_16235 (plasmid) [Acinetobacter sp. TGL-Y2]|nr:hypothetical protein AMD27_16235 [Acinetobacter sp. TGL-Y2]